ncbi:MAG: ABC transporter substrate-binding protein [Bacteroidetes bacterium]|nr:ABC transporter substrate-binding protein [Bacteroidota bacterium]
MQYSRYIDQMKREVWIDSFPERIISLVPSQTEFLIELGLGSRLVGRTRFCIHPKEQVAAIPNIGGTKNLHLDQIRALKPDLIIGNKEENTREDIKILESEFPVWMSDVNDFDAAVSMMLELSQILQKQDTGQKICDELSKIKKEIESKAKRFAGFRVAYAIWKDPWMFAGRKNFIHSMLELAGFENCIAAERYPELQTEEIINLHPDYIFLSSEPFPFHGKHFEASKKAFPGETLKLVDGEAFSWYGSRLLHFSAYLDQLESELKA